METTKQIVYRNEDKALVSVSNTDKVVVAFTDNLPVGQEVTCNNLKTFCETKITTPLIYVVYTSESGILDIEQKEGLGVSISVSELPDEEKALVDSVGVICTQLLNA